jgi:hypothetical protein
MVPREMQYPNVQESGESSHEHRQHQPSVLDDPRHGGSNLWLATTRGENRRDTSVAASNMQPTVPAQERRGSRHPRDDAAALDARHSRPAKRPAEENVTGDNQRTSFQIHDPEWLVNMGWSIDTVIDLIDADDESDEEKRTPDAKGINTVARTSSRDMADRKLQHKKTISRAKQRIAKVGARASDEGAVQDAVFVDCSSDDEDDDQKEAASATFVDSKMPAKSYSARVFLATNAKVAANSRAAPGGTMAPRSNCDASPARNEGKKQSLQKSLEGSKPLVSHRLGIRLHRDDQQYCCTGCQCAI